MRKAIVIALVASLGLCVPQAQAFTMRKQCRYQSLGGPGWSTQNVKDTARCAARKARIDVSKFLSVVSCESGFQSDPSGGHPTYHGPMQYMSSTFYSHYDMFPDWVRWYELRRQLHNVRTAVMIAARYISRRGYSPWAGCA